ncbi:methylmalonyl-CoA epimerase [Litorimonas sp. RW-G-Af-16]|uniref:methylmalonyl-CoA epimerase n=1 Tax=Litorimonas sp. RW-G-Af-16 TaxID=3241168 RepID=UPI00390C89FF
MSKDNFLGPLNHVGIAVPDIDAAIAMYRDVFGVTDITEPKDLPPQGVSYAFVNLPSGQIELITPYGDMSPISKFLKNNPKGGQHHICFEVDDIHAASLLMAERGMRVLNEPRIGAHGTPVVFLHPGDSGGVLIELMETPKDGGH